MLLPDWGQVPLTILDIFRQVRREIAGAHVRASRLSYVGETGWEITCRSENAERIYSALADEGAKPAGLFAQTSMRIEKKFLAYGHELDTDISPIEAGLGFAVDWKKDFIGKKGSAGETECGVGLSNCFGCFRGRKCGATWK